MSSTSIPCTMMASLGTLVEDPAGIGMVFDKDKPQELSSSDVQVLIPAIFSRAVNELRCYIRIATIRLNIE
jgi:hypothetical protein